MRERDLRRLEEEFGEVLERHERTADLSAFEPYADDPASFIREVLGEEPWGAQERIARAIVDRPLVTVRSANGTGKDWLAARLALWWCYARGGLTVLTGPTRQQVSEILMRREVRTAFKAADPELPGQLHVQALRPQGEGRAGIIAKTASETAALTGLHDAAVLFCITEAQADGLGVAFDAAFANAVGEEDRIFAYGNPTAPSGRFYQAHRPGSDWHTLKIPAADVPNVREGRTVVPGLMTRDGVERIAREYGEESGFYVSRVLAEFPEEAEDALFRRPWLEAAAERFEAGELEEAAEGVPYVAALDPARYGPDASVLALRQGPILRGFEVWRGRMDTMELTGRVVEALRERELLEEDAHTGLLVDEVGLGGGVLDRLQEQGYGGTGFNGGRKPEDGDRFYNRRAEAYWTLRRGLERGEVALPEDPELWEELLALRWRPTPSGLIQLEAKRDLSSRIGRSPDKSDALAMAFAVRPWSPPVLATYDGFVA